METTADCRLHYSVMILTLLLLRKDVSSQYLPDYSVKAPQSVVVQEGLCVRIPCTFEIPLKFALTSNTRGTWLKGSVLANNPVASKTGYETMKNRDRIFLTGDVSRGDCSLMINDASQRDTDYYTFKVDDRGAVNTFTNYRTYVKVVELSDKPEISPVGCIVSGDEVTLTCTSPGRCFGASPNITWNGNLKEKMYTINNEDGTSTHHSNITFTPSIEEDPVSLTCTVTLGNNVTTQRVITLDLKDANPAKTTMPVCSSVDSGIIAAMVVSNIVILILIFGGTYCFLKRHMKKRPLGNTTQNSRGTEHMYENLSGQKNDIYYNIGAH
ncbi:sialic acid-binding Ig-like lectin 14 [Engystomops pustulosus]|uniref:sialic acid-binding Ig-like lectin 14 n=1 Tax=Engystomops pustulosus TaxID=76066 RepID=UPI003AFA9D41